MDRATLHLAERLVIAMETMSQDVKNMSAYVYDISCSVSYLVNEKRQKENIPVVGHGEFENPPSAASAAGQEASDEGEYSAPYEQVDERSLWRNGDPEAGESSFIDIASTSIDPNESTDVLISESNPVFWNEVNAEPQSLSDSNDEVCGMYKSTSNHPEELTFTEGIKTEEPSEGEQSYDKHNRYGNSQNTDRFLNEVKSEAQSLTDSTDETYGVYSTYSNPPEEVTPSRLLESTELASTDVCRDIQHTEHSCDSAFNRVSSTVPRMMSDVGGRSQGKYNPVYLQNALSAIQKGLSIREASKKYAIPRSTLQDRIKKIHMEEAGRPCIVSVQGAVGSQPHQTVEEEQDCGSLQDLNAVEIKVEPMDGDLEGMDSNESASERDAGDAESFMEPIVSIPVKPELEETAEETTTEENHEAAKNMEEFLKNVNLQPYINGSEASCSSQMASSLSQPLLAHSRGINDQEDFLKGTSSSKYGVIQLGYHQGQEPFAGASCSSADDTENLDLATRIYLLNKHRRGWEAGKKQGLSLSLPPSVQTEGVNAQEHFSNKSSSFEDRVNQLGNHQGQEPFAVTSCSNADDTEDLDLATRIYLLNKHRRGWEAGKKQGLSLSLPPSVQTEGVNAQEHFSNKSSSFEDRVNQLGNHQGQEPFAVTSCSNADDTEDLDLATRIYLLNKHRRGWEAGKKQGLSLSLPPSVQTEGVNAQEHFSNKSSSFEDRVNQLGNHQGQEPFAVTSCSNADDTEDLDLATRIYLLNKHRRGWEAGKKQGLSLSLPPSVQTEGVNAQEHFSNKSSSFEDRVNQLGNHQGQEPFAVTSCSNADDTEDLDLATRIYLLNMHRKREQYNNQNSGNTSAYNEATHVKTKGEESRCLTNLHKSCKESCTGDFKCSQCNKRFRWKSHLVSHMRIHTGEKPFKCGVCGKGFSHQGNVNQHMRLHTGEKPFGCNLCGKTYTQKISASKHMLSHKCCSLCNKASKLKNHLAVHMRSHKALDRKCFKCTQCDKSFPTNGSLVVHMRYHTGEMRYVCNYCGKRFQLRSEFAKHECRDC